MDKTIRKLERELASSPDDNKLQQQWLRQKIRMGDTVSKTYYKIRWSGKFLSAGNYEFTKQGTQFKTQISAIKSLNHLNERRKRYSRSGFAQTPLLKIELVTYQVHRIEAEAREIDCQEEMRKQKLAEIQAKKRELERQEEELMQS